VRGQRGVVRNEDQRGALDTVQVQQQVEDVLAVGGVEVAGRLVGQDDGRAQDKGARQRNALLLAAGELHRIMVESRRETHRVQQLPGAVQTVLPAAGVVVEFVGQQHIFQRGERRDELVALKDKADRLAAQLS